jgi:Calcineurin-like phosphoesterase
LKNIGNEPDESKEQDFGNELPQNNRYIRDGAELKRTVFYSHPLMNKNAGPVSIYEDFKNSRQEAIDSDFLGFAINDKITDSNGISISYFEYGAVLDAPCIPEPIVCRYNFPKIGNAGIVSPDRIHETRKFIRGTFDRIKKLVYDRIIEGRPYFFEEMFSNKFFLRPVSLKSPVAEVLLVPEINVEQIISPVTNERDIIITVSFGTNPSTPLHDKTLFDLVFKFVNELVLAPHAIYANKTWDNFVIMHVTDIHVSRRLEYVKDDLKKMSAERPDLVDEYNIGYFNNYNNNFRNFISYVNTLYKNNSVDCILATGDLIDYIFDSGEQTARTPRNPSNVDRMNGNNFDYFKRLILGLEPGRDGTKNEELLVPIFTTLGNHDYREMPYSWVFDLDAVVMNKSMSNYAPANLRSSEAKAIEGGETPTYGVNNAAKMARVNTNLPGYDTINDRRSYIVNLGPHRVVMLDSAQDVGILDSGWDGFRHFMGWDSADESRFAQASPNCKGVQQEHIGLLKQALSEAGPAGVLIVGIHAPLIDMGYYPHYLRETDRLAPNHSVMRRGFPYFSEFRSFIDHSLTPTTGTFPPLASTHLDVSGWPADTPYFKYGGVDYTLANGVSKGLNEEFLEICAGVGIGVPRRVDLVLSGHGHKNVEFRIGFDADKKLLFFHDYYTENPTKYYGTKLLSESDFNEFIEEWNKSPTGRELLFKSYMGKMIYHFTAPKEGITVPTFTEVLDGHAQFIEKWIEVPPYPTPLNKTSDKMAWWTKHRPLVIQTAALGPIETFHNRLGNPDRRLSDYSFFHGCRKIIVKNNSISSIEYIHMNEIRGSKPRLCSLKELCRVREISFPASVRSLAEEIRLIPPIAQRLKIG